MISFKKILVPTDFSECARRAAQHAAELAMQLGGGEIHLFHAVEIPPGLSEKTQINPEGGKGAQGLASYLNESSRADLEALVGELGSETVEVTYSADVGKPEQLIMSRACDFDLIVMGTHGRSGLRHLLIGSVAERLVRISPVPVFTIRTPSEDTLPEAEIQARVETEG